MDTPPALVRQFIRGEYGAIHPRLKEYLDVLSEVGAPECWHKKSTFKAHLQETFKISILWGLSHPVAEVMLFHSAYSNSYVNLAVFKAEKDRPRLGSLVGKETEQLIYLFCIVPRHELIYENLLKKLSDDHLAIPAEGMTVQSITNKAPLHLSSRLIAVFVAMTMVDFCEQLYSWQDQMFQNDNGKLYYSGKNAHVLWPGPMKPGLWMASLSRMGRLVRSSHESQANGKEQGPPCFTTQPTTEAGGSYNDAPLPPIPRVFNECTAILTEADERKCRDLYWDVVSNKTEPEHAAEAQAMLEQAVQHNPHVAEPHVLLAQLLMQQSRFEDALAQARRALELFCQWGTAWDKRMAWDAWLAWTPQLSMGEGAKMAKARQPNGYAQPGLSGRAVSNFRVTVRAWASRPSVPSPVSLTREIYRPQYDV